MSLELNAIPSVENLEFYRELASLEARYFVGFSNHINRGPLKGARYKNAHMMMNLFTDLITAKEENSEVDVYFIQKSCEAIIKSIEEDIPKAALEQKEIEEAEERELEERRSEQRIVENKYKSSRDDTLFMMAAHPNPRVNKQAVKMNEIFEAQEEKQEQEERKLKETELTKKLSLAIDKEMYSIIYEIQGAAALKTADFKSLTDHAVFIDENGALRASKNDVGYLTKDAKNHINNQLDAVRGKKSKLIEFKNKYDELNLEIKSLNKTLHPLNLNNNVLYEDGDVDAEMAKLYEKLSDPGLDQRNQDSVEKINKMIVSVKQRIETREKINKKIEELEEIKQLIDTPEKIKKKIEDLEKVKQIIETPEEKQKRSFI